MNAIKELKEKQLWSKRIWHELQGEKRKHFSCEKTEKDIDTDMINGNAQP